MKNFQLAILVLVIFAVVLISGCAKDEENIGIANPASVNCEEKGGTLDIRTSTEGGQIGYCKFANGKECEEWAFFRGECNATKE